MAGGIPHKFIDDLLARVDIVSLIGGFVTLKKKGNSHMACCPFHSEKTPSFSVSAEKQFYHCFGCHAGGDAIKFLMEYQHLDFVEAVEALAQKNGIDVPRESGSANKPISYQHSLDTLEEVSNFYTQQLSKNPAARAYLQKRQLDSETIARFRIGYAPQGFDHLQQLASFAKDKKWFFSAGLLSQKNNKHYVRFRHRLMFPIRDRRGRVIAFGGRVLSDDDQPKYMNSPETEVFHKRKTLYGLYELRQSRQLNQIIVVEGYMDVVSLASHGIHNSVATLGTAVTQDHIRQLFKISPHLIFCFDGDTAGHKAAVAALEQTLSVFRDGKEVTFIFLPNKEDPDSLIKQIGKDGFEKLLDQAQPLSSFLFSHLSQDLDLSTPEGGAAFAERARPLLGTIPAGTFRDLTLKTLSDKAGVTIEHIRPTKAAAPTVQRKGEIASVKRHYSILRIIACLLVRNPSLANEENILANKDIKELNVPGAKFLATLIQDIQSHQITNTASLMAFYRESEHEEVIHRLAEWNPPQTGDEKKSFDEKKEFYDTMNQLQKKLNAQEQQELIELAKSRPLSEAEKDRFNELLGR